MHKPRPTFQKQKVKEIINPANFAKGISFLPLNLRAQ